MPFYSPLRYPGGKRKLVGFVMNLIEVNSLNNCKYVEPYCGGAAVAVHLLLETKLPKIVINDIDPCLFSFWQTIKDEPTELCRRIARTRVDMNQWHRQRSVVSAKAPSRLDLAFATLFLNRTNRSGVLMAGVIGGKEQRGRWKINARFNKRELIRRIEAIASEANRLEVYGQDAMELVARLDRDVRKAFVFLDPPYYHKTDSRLYRDDYSPDDHRHVAAVLRNVSLPWFLTYDQCDEIRRLYKRFEAAPFRIAYTAGRKRVGAEILFVSPGIHMPTAHHNSVAWSALKGRVCSSSDRVAK